MKRLLPILMGFALLLLSSTEGWSLPPCEGSPTSKHYVYKNWTNCEGTLTYNDGDKYVGEWKDGSHHGQGTYTYANGDKSVGEFKDGSFVDAGSTATSLKLPSDGVNSIHHLLRNENNRVRFGTQADPATVTLGPTDGGIPRYPPYDGKNSFNIKMPLMTPVLAPLDMTFVGFENRSAHTRGRLEPFDDLELCFESVSTEWLGLVLCVYHLHTTPLLRGHLKHKDCGIQEKWGGDYLKGGFVYYLKKTKKYAKQRRPVDMEARRLSTEACDPLLYSTLKRGDIIGYSGQVGNNPHVGFRFKVRSTEQNPLTKRGLSRFRQADLYLHWVQPLAFFNWQCFEPDAIFPPKVLAYPFDCKLAQ